MRPAALLALLSAGCLSAQTPEPPGPSDTETAPAQAAAQATAAVDSLRLAPGEAAEREGHRVAFVRVVEDSRCPVGVQCVWEGRAQIEVEVDGRPFVLTLPRPGAPDDEAQTAEWEGVQVTFLDLLPYPGSEGPEAARALLTARPSTV